MNYIHSFDVQVPGVTDPASLTITTPVATALQTIQYFDGLGRPVQTVQKEFTTEGYDMVKPITYNSVGLDETDYEPYAVTTTSTGNFQSGFASDQPAFYANPLSFGDANGKSPTDFEKSPLNRVLKQAAPGTDWQLDKHPVLFDYLTNNTSDMKVVLWKVSDNSCMYTNYYAANQLYVTKTTNEDGGITYEFKDKQGQVVLKRSVLDASTKADTYYVYDDFGLLRFVLSPEGSAQITADFDASTPLAKKYVYCYKYDARKRLIEKQIPGKDVEYYVYDKTDKVILYQDGNMRNTGGNPNADWMFTKYDALGRVIMTGIIGISKYGIRDYLQVAANNSSYKCWEFISYTGTSRPNNNNYYSDQSYPTLTGSAYYTLNTLNYYDSYNVWLNGSNTPIASSPDSYNIPFTLPQTSYTLYNPELLYVSGKPTINFVKYNLSMLASAVYYDVFGRVIQKFAQNQPRDYSYDRYTILYKGLTANIVKTEHKNFVYSNANLTLNDVTDYTYDAAGRPLTYTYTYNGTGTTGTPRIINYTYTTLGQVKSKQIKDNTALMQTVDYTYNIRGWLSKINDPAIVSATGDLFGMELLYNTQNYRLNNFPVYNGNISATIWQKVQPSGVTTPNVTGQKGYRYYYDKLNRIIKSNYAEVIGSSVAFNDKYSELIHTGSTATDYRPYDLNGNILTLNRYGIRTPTNVIGTIDELTYSYEGNKLIAVDNDVSPDIGGDFIDNGHFYSTSNVAEYAYDANGNLTRDDNKQILSITYNYLNQPTSITKTGGYRVEYTYDAVGTKRSQSYYINGTLSKTTIFYTNFVYENNYPAWVTYDEGRVVLNSNGTVNINEAYLKDHLGNVRVVYYMQAGILKTQQVNSYYPFGMNIKGLTADGSTPYPTYKKNEYLYNGKMMQDEMGLGWLDYGARFYDAVLGRWHSEDPVTKHPESPYAAFSNNPVRFVDTNGADTSFANNTARKEFNTVYNQISKEISRLDKKINKKADKIQNDEAHSSRYERQVTKLNERRSNVYELKNSFDAVISSEVMFKFKATPNPENNLAGGGTHLNMDSKEVEISYFAGATGTLVHETRHGAGYTYGEWNQISNKEFDGYDYQDEFEAYKTQNIYQYYFKSKTSVHELYGMSIRDIILKNYSTKDYIIKEFNQNCVP